ncbi:hypothetical protein [Methylorubrum extorquens]|uniref:Uncharacterized protein n=2 Tax=Methylorubrum extorquens TaxID=408 RepID=C5B5X5_METEA|nr:hypothetical protein [Methylorubrum extorquens]ACS43857.1 Hypothetical protein MexAM1_META2p1080 [Methylorubrum extorquens AM1]MCP1546295.1 hypothetical protein [Methylorubrum extorquens]MCP1590962.1 hypothetical protein [Methylorubrum extorquens]
MPLLQRVYEPTQADLYARGMELGVHANVPKDWLSYIYWAVPLEN